MWDGVNRRRFPRAEYPCLITIRKNTPPMEAILTHTENISVGGVRVIISKKIEIMTEVELEVDLKDTLPTIISKGTISWVKEAPYGRKSARSHYDIGIQFVSLKDEYRGRVQNVVDRIASKS